jgi:hypothetical protein
VDWTAVLSLVIAELAIVLGLVVVIAMWRRHRSHRRVARLRHPAAPPPIRVTPAADGARSRLRVDVRPDVPTIRVDIASWRACGTDEWQSVPIIAPVSIGPGGWALLPGETAALDSEIDVVIGWTIDHPDGPVTGSRTFVVPPDGELAADRFRRESAATLSTGPALLALAMLLGGAVLVGSALWNELTADESAATSPSESDG